MQGDWGESGTGTRMNWRSRLRWALPYLELICAVEAAALWYMQGGAAWYTGEWPGPWPLLLLAVPWLLRPAAFGFSLRLSVLDAALLLFLASAGLGVWAAYDPGPALAKFWLIVGAVGLCYALAHQPDWEHLSVSLAFFALFGVALVLYFFATNDWDAMPKVAGLVAAGKRISALLPALPGHRMHPNVVGGMLAAVLPLTVGLSALSWARGRRWLALVWVAAALVSGAGWLFSMSRGAWLALAGVMAVWGGWRVAAAWLRRRDGQTKRERAVRLALAAGVLLAGAAAVALVALFVLPRYLAGMQTLANRLDLLRNSLLLARDYAFTGSGLGMFPMQYSIYTLLIHCRHTVHSHNLLVNLLIEQGALGLTAYLALVVWCVVLCLRGWRRVAHRVVCEAVLVSLAAILAHGMVDDALYGSRGALLLFVPFGIAQAAASIARAPSAEACPQRRRRWLGWAGAVVLVMILTVAGLAWRRPLLGVWYANRGAVEQSRLELAAYTGIDQAAGVTLEDLDRVRRQGDLGEAIGWLERAIQADPANATARQRLATIALSRGQYETALAHMQAAWESGHRDRVTRLLLGDALVANGRVEEAVEVVRGLTWSEERLAHLAWYRYWRSEDYARAAYSWHALVLLDPDNADAARWQAEAEARAQR